MINHQEQSFQGSKRDRAGGDGDGFGRSTRLHNQLLLWGFSGFWLLSFDSCFLVCSYGFPAFEAPVKSMSD